MANNDLRHFAKLSNEPCEVNINYKTQVVGFRETFACQWSV